MKSHVKKKQLKKKLNFKKKLRLNIRTVLVKHLCWPKSISNFIAHVVCALLSISGVWHKKIAQAADGDALVESTERRIQRFFCDFVINYHCFSVMLYQLMGVKNKLTIILDRTNWDYGKSHINIFVAAALYQQAGMHQTFALPLVWEVFDKKGNSNTAERKQLMTRLFKIVGKENIEVVLADREFIGDEWTSFLHENKIPFIVRIKKNMLVEYQGNRVSVMLLFASVKHNQRMRFNVTLNGIPVHLAGTRSIDGELVIVAASMDVSGDPLDRYRLRWMIELFFKSAKTKGFNIEETHMTDPVRIKRLFALVALASACAVAAGVVRHHFKKIPIKNHGRPEFSIFTYGLDFIRELFRGVDPTRIFGISKKKLLLNRPRDHISFVGFCFFVNDEKPVFALIEG